MNAREFCLTAFLVAVAAISLLPASKVSAAEPSLQVVRGANLPWGAYGHDIGNPAGGGAHLGFSSVAGRVRLEAALHERRDSLVRVWLFCDLRAGVNFNMNGTISFRNETTVYDDMDALLEVAASNNVQLLLVLFDRTLGVEGDIGSARRGLHPEVITDPATRSALISLFDNRFMDRYVNNPTIYGWDILNEPEVAPEVMRGVVTNPQQWDFVRLFAEMIAAKLAGSAAGQLLTTGNKDRKYLAEMLTYWRDQGYRDVLSLYEFHYYNAMGKADLAPLTDRERQLVRDHPVLLGEVSSASGLRRLGSNTWTEITEKMDYISQNGFAGGLFWHDASLTNSSDDDLYLSPAEWSESTNWTPAMVRTWHRTGRRESKVFERPDFYGSVYYHYEDSDSLGPGYGRIDALAYGEPGYEGAVGLQFDYPAAPSVDYVVSAYTNADYSDPGDPHFTGSPALYTYYADGGIGGINYPYQEVYTIGWDDGSYSTHTSEVHDATGKAYVFKPGGYPWTSRYNWGNYVGYRNAWNANLELYGGTLFRSPDGPEYQSIYEFLENNNSYSHIDTYHRTSGGDPWPPGQSVEPSEANHPLHLAAILLRPHVDTLAEIVDVYDVTATDGPNGSLSPGGALLVPHGVTVPFVVVSDPHHHIANIRTNGVSLVGYAYGVGFTNTVFAWSNVTANGSIEARFAGNATNSPQGTLLLVF
jgi:hypothetical protein